uniref:Uncharacterized protein n=1 Tax=Panagrellus redivivus TaxID=6233 RepID=A0A7E4VB89_PANRE
MSLQYMVANFKCDGAKSQERSPFSRPAMLQNGNNSADNGSLTNLPACLAVALGTPPEATTSHGSANGRIRTPEMTETLSQPSVYTVKPKTSDA